MIFPRLIKEFLQFIRIIHTQRSFQFFFRTWSTKFGTFSCFIFRALFSIFSPLSTEFGNLPKPVDKNCDFSTPIQRNSIIFPRLIDTICYFPPLINEIRDFFASEQWNLRKVRLLLDHNEICHCFPQQIDDIHDKETKYQPINEICDFSKLDGWSAKFAIFSAPYRSNLRFFRAW